MKIEQIKKLINYILGFLRSKKEGVPDNKSLDSDIKNILPDKKDVKDLFLVFEAELSYLFNHPNTIKIREIIKDEFGGGKNNWDLQCTEYVQYKLQQIGITIQWPIKSGRDGGRWADIFEKYKIYKVSDVPKLGCAVSFKERHGAYGHIAFVEEILENEAIKISEANFPDSGKYSERTLPKPQWQDKYKGRFIDFS